MYQGRSVARRPGARLGLRGLFSLLSLSFFLAGCAIHPIPKDVTGLSTYEIVRQIRCETRQAVFDSAIKWLIHDQDVDQRSREIGLEFAKSQNIAGLKPSLFKGKYRTIFEYFWGTGVAYNYNLQMTETNTASTEFNLLKPNFLSNNNIALKAAADLQRQNTRTFTITDTFQSLMEQVPESDCQKRIVGPNYIYPIAGRIGMEEVIQSFVNLSLHGNLAGTAKTPTGPPTMVDTLVFTTTLSGSVAPKLTFSPVGQNWQTSNGSITAEIKRQDLHTLTVGLSVATTGAPKTQMLRTTPLFGRLLTASGGPSEQAAAEAVDQALTQKVFSRTINIYP